MIMSFQAEDDKGSENHLTLDQKSLWSARATLSLMA